MLDGNRCFYPIEKDNSGNLRTPAALNCSPVHSIHAAVRYSNPERASRNQQRYTCAVVAFALRRNSLVQSIIDLDVENVKAILNTTEPDLLEKKLRECSDGSRNIFHLCASISAPRPRKDFPKNLAAMRPDTGEKITYYLYSCVVIFS